MPSAELAPGSTMTSVADSAGDAVAITITTVAASSTAAERGRKGVGGLGDLGIGASRSDVSAPAGQIERLGPTAAHYGPHRTCGEGSRAPAGRGRWRAGRVPQPAIRRSRAPAGARGRRRTPP